MSQGNEERGNEHFNLQLDALSVATLMEKCDLKRMVPGGMVVVGETEVAGEQLDIVLAFRRKLVGWITPVENKDVAFFEHLEVLEQQRPLTGCVGCNAQVVGQPARDVDEGTHRGLRAVRTLRPPEVIVEFLASPEVELRSVDREDAPTSPQPKLRVSLREGRCRVVQQVMQHLDRDLVPSLAERRCRHRLFARQRNVMRSALVPECVEEVTVAATVGIANHEEEKRHQQLWRQDAITGEVVGPRTPFGRAGLGEEGRNQLKDLADSLVFGTDFQRLACRVA